MKKSQVGVIGSKVSLVANVSVPTDMQPCWPHQNDIAVGFVISGRDSKQVKKSKKLDLNGTI